MITCTKRFTDIPFAHRQHTHPGHCRLIHGHNWTFELTFGANRMDPCGFVIDFGGRDMQAIKEWITTTFDHKLLLNSNDPWKLDLQHKLLHAEGPHGERPPEGFQLAAITVVPDGSCEGLARWVFYVVNEMLDLSTDKRVFLVSVKVEEDSKNSATFRP